MLSSFAAAALVVAMQGPKSTIDTTVALQPTRYDLDLKVDIPNKELVASARIAVTNATHSPVRTASFLLYRLMRATDVRDFTGRRLAGRRLAFTQPVVEFEDHPTLQVRLVNITLPRPLPPGQSAVVQIDYRGALLGYAETGMSYVRDHIDSAYTLIRLDAFAYPFPGVPSHRVNRRAGLPTYDYRARVTVPEGFTVANGGQLLGTTSAPGWTTFEYRNIKPAWRMDFAVARFTVREGGAARIYHLPEDSAGGARLIEAMNRTLETYARWFGPLRSASQFTLIEIPDGWGSQADVTSILQAAAAFRNPKRQYELYHELSHLWNVTDTDPPSPRWNEGLATFLEDVTTDSLERRSTTDSSADRVSTWLSGIVKTNARLANVRMADYGRMGMSDYSYSVGALMFYTMYRLMGHQAFTRLVGAYYQRYEASGGSTDDFVRLAKELSPVSLEQVFRDWLYSSRWTEIVANAPGHALPDRYRAVPAH
jgi:hypothetical protein